MYITSHTLNMKNVLSKDSHWIWCSLTENTVFVSIIEVCVLLYWVWYLVCIFVTKMRSVWRHFALFWQHSWTLQFVLSCGVERP